MRSKIAVILLAALMVLPAAVIMASSDCSDAAETYTVVGYIATTDGEALGSKTVVISEGSVDLGYAASDANGMFSIDITPSSASALSSLYLRVLSSGSVGSSEICYKILTGPCITPKGGTGDDKTVWILDLTSITPVGNTYTISSSVSQAIFVMNATDPVYTVEGYVASENGSALASKNVIISTTATALGQGATDSTGKFSIEIQTSDVSSLFIRIVYEEATETADEVDYKIISAPEGVELLGTPGDDHTVMSLDLTEFNLSGSTYTLASSLIHGIQVANATSNVTVHVVGKDSKELYQAKISLYDGQKIVASGTTNYYGVCELATAVKYDTYRLVVKCNGYYDYDESLVVNEAQMFPEISLTEKTAPTFLGMTTYHLLMMFGVILGLALVVISYVLVARNWKGIEED